MAFQLNLNLNVCLAWLSHNGGLGMGQWADDAVKRFFAEGDQGRRKDELELINHHKLVAGAEGLWKDLRKFIKSETGDFNDQTRPDFFKITESADGFHIDVVAPMASLKCWFDNRVPNVKAERSSLVKDETETYELAVRTTKDRNGRDIYFLTDTNGQATQIKIIGAQLLNPLVA